SRPRLVCRDIFEELASPIIVDRSDSVKRSSRSDHARQRGRDPYGKRSSRMPVVCLAPQRYLPESSSGQGHTASAIAHLHRSTLQHPLTPVQLEEYDDKGYVILRGVFAADEVAAFRDEADRLYHELDAS